MTKFSRIIFESEEITGEILPDGTIRTENKYEIEYTDKDGNYHRVGGPAHTYKTKAGGIKIWYQHGVMHREDGPARIDEYGDVELWYLHGKLHRTDGPAWINRKKGEEEYYVNGRLLSKEEFEKHFGNG